MQNCIAGILSIILDCLLKVSVLHDNHDSFHHRETSLLRYRDVSQSLTSSQRKLSGSSSNYSSDQFSNQDPALFQYTVLLVVFCRLVKLMK